ncbi:MAG: PEP-CTERM sorting domain-containing protein [Verrucomicrobiota bacterium]
MQKSFVTKFVPALALASVLSLTQTSNAQFAASVVSYNSGVGFQPGYTTPSSALGEPSRVTPGMYGGPVNPFNSAYLDSQVVSIGVGGSLTVQFSSPILNNPGNAFGLDFNIFGNAGFVITNEYDFNTFDWVGTPATSGSLYGSDATATRVSVSSDGINYFTLNPTLAPTVDALFPTDGLGDFGLMVNPALTAADFAGLDLAGIRALYNGASGGRGYDISWAQDGLGQSVLLASVEFVRIEVLAGNAEIDGLVAVPEPTTLSLAFLGLGALIVARRNRA